MPIPEEIRKVEAGEKVRPPREWFNATLRQVRRQYPKFGIERLNRIAAGIWHKYPKATKLRLLRRYQKERKGNPDSIEHVIGECNCPVCKRKATLLKKYGKSNPKKNGKLYSGLRRSWIGYKIAIRDHDIEKASRYARIINQIREIRGEIPLEFTELDKMRRM